MGSSVITGNSSSSAICPARAPDPSLTPASGMVVACELADRLGMIKLLDAPIGRVKTRGRGFTGGALLVGLVTAQLAGEDFLVRLDRQRADVAGQVLAASPRNRGICVRFALWIGWWEGGCWSSGGQTSCWQYRRFTPSLT
ncbi:MAG: hypothetical protein ACRDRW_18530 [Pseudonocardiaceae bacterium]